MILTFQPNITEIIEPSLLINDTIKLTFEFYIRFYLPPLVFASFISFTFFC